MARLGSRLAPRSDRTLQLAECFGLRAAERGATREVWSNGNEALFFNAPKNVSGSDIVVTPGRCCVSQPRGALPLRLY